MELAATEEEHNGQAEEESSTGPLVRPTSLMVPEREQLKFQIPTLVGAPTEVVQLVQQIQHVAEQFLYHWKTFPIGEPGQLLAVALVSDPECLDYQFASSPFSSSDTDSSGSCGALLICFSRPEQEIEGNQFARSVHRATIR